jgi:tetratricopeptide (TPR) repeat protein
MIVKNRALSLERCLKSVHAAVDRIVIGDTGSQDDSVAVARSFGAEVIAVPWHNDFAHARNCVLQRSQCDWILVLDSDEMLDHTAAQTLPTATAREDIFAYDVCIWNYVRETNSRFGEQGVVANPYLVEASRDYPAYGKCVNTRLFRRHPEVFFERPVHETVSLRIESMGLRRAMAPFVIHHFGHAEDTSKIRSQKNQLYLGIAKDNLKSTPNDARAYFELGLGELEHYRRPETALQYFSQALRLDPKSAPTLLFSGICLLRLRRFDEALERLEHSRRMDGLSIVLQEAIGDVYLKLARYEEAEAAYSLALSLGSRSALIEAKLGATEVYLGRKQEGVQRVQEALRRDPGFPELYAVASATALLAGNIDLAAQITETRIHLGDATAFDYVLAGSLRKSAGDPDHGRALLREGLSRFPEDRELQEALSG